jgi:protein translocase SecG subunit
MNFLNILAAESSIIDISVRQVLEPALMIAMAVFGLMLIIAVLMQKATADGVSALSGESSDNYMSKNKGSSLEFKLKVATIVLMGLLLIVSVVYFIIKSI